jgi:hypothetical protein
MHAFPLQQGEVAHLVDGESGVCPHFGVDPFGDRVDLLVGDTETGLQSSNRSEYARIASVPRRSTSAMIVLTVSRISSVAAWARPWGSLK